MRETRRKIVAIGGGEIGRPGHPVETTKIDKEIIRLTGKKHPRLLFIPTASGDSESYYEAVKKHFEQDLRCKTDVLYLLKKELTRREMEEKVFSSDIIYVGGGNTRKMMHAWRKCGLDEILRKAWERGLVLSGLSAGSMCWFKWGHSMSRETTNRKPTYVRAGGLGMIKALHRPHWNTEKKEREKSLKAMIKKNGGVAIVIDDCAAMEVIDGEYRIITSKTKAGAYKLHWKNGKFLEETIAGKSDFRPLEELLEK